MSAIPLAPEPGAAGPGTDGPGTHRPGAVPGFDPAAAPGATARSEGRRARRWYTQPALVAGIVIIGVIVAMVSLSPSLTLVALLPLPLIVLVAVRMGLIQLP